MVSKSFFVFVLFSIIFNKNVKIANRDYVFYSLSSNCGKINGFEMYKMAVLGWAYYPTQVAYPEGGVGGSKPPILKPNPCFKVKCSNCASAVRAIISKQL